MSTVKAPLPLADNIRLLRKRKGLSQTALGQQVGLSRSNIASYENAKAEPRAAKLAELAAFFGVSLERLITGSFSEDDSSLKSNDTARNEALTLLKSQLEGFSKRNERLKGILTNLRQQQARVGANEAARADLDVIIQQFDHMLAIMTELLRNDEEIVRALTTVGEEVTSG